MRAQRLFLGGEKICCLPALQACQEPDFSIKRGLVLAAWQLNGPHHPAGVAAAARGEATYAASDILAAANGYPHHREALQRGAMSGM